jgi:hypothetical protein
MMIRHTATATNLGRAHSTDGVGRAKSVRELKYGVTQTSYQSLHELEEFGLIHRTHDPRALVEPGDESDDPRVVARFQLLDDGLAVPAAQKLEHVFEHHPTPWRIIRYNPGFSDWTDDFFGLL